MIDISHKRSTLRYAKAQGTLKASSEIIQRVRKDSVPKGNIAEVARSAGIQAAKKASEWMVFCHSMPLDWAEISMELEEDHIIFISEVRSVWKTGMEMEAMAAVSAALLNAYDMLKPLKADIEIGGIRLVEKSGGKSDITDTFDPPLKTALLTVSEAKKSGKRKDKGGDIFRSFMQNQPVELVTDELLEENPDRLSAKLEELCDQNGVDLIFVAGASGPSSSDITPEVIRRVTEKIMPGIGEAMRQYGYERTPFSMLSDQVAGVRGSSLIVGLPGSSRGMQESLDALFPGLLHIFKILKHS